MNWKNSCIVLFLMREEGVLRCELLLLSFLPDWQDSEASFSLSLSAMVLPGVRHCSEYFCIFGVILFCCLLPGCCYDYFMGLTEFLLSFNPAGLRTNLYQDCYFYYFSLSYCGSISPRTCRSGSGCSCCSCATLTSCVAGMPDCS